VIEASGLHTIVVKGGDTAALTRKLKQVEGVEQVAPFGTDLHVVGLDPDLLQRRVRAAIAGSGATAAEDATSLEDVFIRLMSNASDNFGGNGKAPAQ
jgi:ABC-2 type transport system ATP-binding protein